MTEEFFKDRQIECEVYALINFFKLLRQAESAEMDTYNSKYFPEETFALIGGKETFRRLLMDYNNGNIDIINNSIGGLFQILEGHINHIQNNNFSKSVNVYQAIETFGTIKKFYSDIYSINGNQNESALYDLVTLPLPQDMISEILKLKSKTKKIGER